MTRSWTPGFIVRQADWVKEPRPGVEVELTREGREKMAAVTRPLLGKTLGVFVDGLLLTHRRSWNPSLEETDLR